MVEIKSVKYACLQCIKGHRTGTCSHTKRPLIQLRKRGRPNCAVSSMLSPLSPGERGPQNPVAPQSCCVGKPDKNIAPRYKMHTPTSEHTQPSSCCSKKLRESSIKSEQTKTGVLAAKPELTSPPAAEQTAAHAGIEQDLAPRQGPDDDLDCYYFGRYKFVKLDTDLYKRILLDPAEQKPPTMLRQAGQPNPTSTSKLPDVIAPMELDGTEVGPELLAALSESKMWTVGPDQSLEFAPSCVIPNQCRCDENCVCDNCYTHGTFFSSAI